MNHNTTAAEFRAHAIAKQTADDARRTSTNLSWLDWFEVYKTTCENALREISEQHLTEDAP